MAQSPLNAPGDRGASQACLDLTGTISTFAGGLGPEPALHVGQSPWTVYVAGTTLYLADSYNGLVRFVNLSTDVETPGPSSPSHSGVTGAVTDLAGNLFLADPGQNAIFESPVGGGALVNVFQAGPPATGFPPLALGTDPTGHIYVAVPFQQHTTSSQVFLLNPGAAATLIAGTGFSGPAAGDYGLATLATLDNPLAVNGDALGNLYIADSANNRVRRVDPVTKIITTIAGTGIADFGGDGGPATAALLNNPTGVWADASGDVFIADAANHRVRKVGPTGIITTVAGTGVAGFAGDGGPATAAELSGPRSVTLDAGGNLLISDEGNLRVRRVSASDGSMSTIAGDGDVFLNDGGSAVGAALWQPEFVALGATSTAYYSDSVPRVPPSQGSQVRFVDASGTMTVFARGGVPAPAANFVLTTGVVVDATGAVYVADGQANVVVKVGPGSTAAVVAGGGSSLGDGGPATSAQLSAPDGLALDVAGNLYIADSGDNRIRRVTPAGVISTVAGDGTAAFTGDGGPATAAELNGPQDVSVAPDGSLYIADSQNQRLRRVAPDGTISTVVAAAVVINGVAAAADASVYYTAEDQQVHRLAGGTNTVVAGTGTQGFSGDGGPATAAMLNHPIGIAVDACGVVTVVDGGNNRLRRIA